MNQNIKARKLKAAFEQEVSDVIEEISPKDIQYKVVPDRRYYFNVGQSVLSIEDFALMSNLLSSRLSAIFLLRLHRL